MIKKSGQEMFPKNKGKSVTICSDGNAREIKSLMRDIRSTSGIRKNPPRTNQKNIRVERFPTGFFKIILPEIHNAGMAARKRTMLATEFRV
jgi:hypothetical protein